MGTFGNEFRAMGSTKTHPKFYIPNFPAQNRGCNACHEPLEAAS